MTGIVIVGAGHAGVQAAVSLREQCCDEKITLLSDEADYPYHKPPLSKTFLASEAAPLLPLRGETYFYQKNIEFRRSCRVNSICRARGTLLLEAGEEIRFQRLVLATGMVPRFLGVPGETLRNVHSLRSAQDARRLRRTLSRSESVVIVGGGFIGLEVAAMLAVAGKKVTLCEAAPRLLSRGVSSEMSGSLMRYLATLGVDIRLSASIREFSSSGEDHAAGVVFNDGELIGADCILVCIGAVPNTSLAAASGLHVNRGVVTDCYLTTSDENISAIGDCAEFPDPTTGAFLHAQSIQNATDQARCVARNLIHPGSSRFAALAWFWSDIGKLKLQIAGSNTPCDEVINCRDSHGEVAVAWLLNKGRLIGVETLNRPSEHMLARVMLTKGFTPDRLEMVAGDADRLKRSLASVVG